MAAEKSPDPAVIPYKFKPAALNDLRRCEEVTTEWVLWIPAGTPTEVITDSDYWAAVGHKLNPGDKIRGLLDDMSAEVELRVISGFQGGARVHPVAVHHFPTVIADEAAAFDDAYMIEHGGPQSLYIVVRKIDGQVLSKHHSNRQAAVAWLMAYLAQRAQQQEAK